MNGFRVQTSPPSRRDAARIIIELIPEVPGDRKIPGVDRSNLTDRDDAEIGDAAYAPGPSRQKSTGITSDILIQRLC